MQLVLSLFPGIGLLDLAFEEEGFTVVRGPDVLWGGDIRRFRPPAGKFDGVIGGPPCQAFSRLRFLNPRAGMRTGNLIPEFERCVIESDPTWFLMENAPGAPLPFGTRPKYEMEPLSAEAAFNRPGPLEDYYGVHSFLLNNRSCFKEDGKPATQNRVRRWSFGYRGERRLLMVETAALESPFYDQAATSSSCAVSVKIGGSGKVKRTYHESGAQHGPAMGPNMAVEDLLELQGLPRDMLDDSPFTSQAKRKMIGNGVPRPMGRAIARAVKEALAAV